MKTIIQAAFPGFESKALVDGDKAIAFVDREDGVVTRVGFCKGEKFDACKAWLKVEANIDLTPEFSLGAVKV